MSDQEQTEVLEIRDDGYDDTRVISVIIVGARGRMGTTLLREVIGSDVLTLAGAVAREGSPGIGLDAGKIVGTVDVGITLSDELRPRRGAVVVDFSLPEATADNLQRAVDAGAPFVCGTTGVDEETEEAMRKAAESIPVVFAANFSVGVTLLTKLSEIATRALGDGWDAELFEIHHRHKRDAPSGTALRLGSAVSQARGKSFAETFAGDRTSRSRARTDDEIGVVALRGGDSVGEHTLMFLGEGERLELTHRAGDRAIFARGALRAARWAAGREPGLYDMADVLGLSGL